VVEIETGLREHGLEDVEAELHLAPVLLPVHPRVGGPLDVFAHHADATGLPGVAQQISQMNCCDGELPICAGWVNYALRY
jgi:hypothetical protein